MHDVIIVGARVAGSATALLLARRGLKVLVVDRAGFPSDTLSTHQVQVTGVAALARWGLLGDILAAGTPATRRIRFDQGEAVITGQVPRYDGADLMCSPRRTLLDKVLVDAARAAGAEVRENFTAEGLTGDGVVTGIRGREKGAPPVTEQAPLVIGADGKHSLVARTVSARAYRAKPPQSIAFYTYWDGVPGSEGQIYGRPGCAVGAWPTNDGLLMTYLAWPIARFSEFRQDVEGSFLRTLDATGLGEAVRAGRRAERFRGTPDLPSYFRQPCGPGWALVGDAGLLLDPITGQGISHAFRDAELLADAVADGLGGIRPLGGALRRYHRARDAAARPMYDFTARLAAISPPLPAETALFRRLSQRQQDADAFIGALTGAVPLRQFMSPANIVRLVGVRGLAGLILGQARRGRPRRQPV
ncbi:MAG TPA: NAD(P)/FAD-dependent oxidoreductase [Streptosporangiaceae bacterium]|jgi:flavin-dependent dehydrogenase